MLCSVVDAQDEMTVTGPHSMWSVRWILMVERCVTFRRRPSPLTVRVRSARRGPRGWVGDDVDGAWACRAHWKPETIHEPPKRCRSWLVRMANRLMKRVRRAVGALNGSASGGDDRLARHRVDWLLGLRRVAEPDGGAIVPRHLGVFEGADRAARKDANKQGSVVQLAALCTSGSAGRFEGRSETA